MFHKLLRRGLPRCFEFNSVCAVQPMYTSATNKDIPKRLDTLNQFLDVAPKVPPPKTSVNSHAAICQVFQNQGSVKSPWESLGEEHISKTAISAYTFFQREANSGQLNRSPKAATVYFDFLIGRAKSLVEGATYCLRGRGSEEKYN